jgi:hypothetical protein
MPTLTQPALTGVLTLEVKEVDQLLDPTYVTFQITGWVPEETLTNEHQRYFYHLVSEDETPEQWEVYTDNHTFTLFWAPLDNLPEIISPQDEWVGMLKDTL